MAKNFYGFEKKPSKAITVVEIIIICILILLIASIAVFNLLFQTDGSAPTLFGHQIYLNQSTTMGDAVPKDSAVLASTDISDLKAKDVVLTKIQAADREYIAILRIQDMQNRDGVNYYLLKGDNSPETEALLVPQSAIIAKAEQFNVLLGKVLLFSTSKLGIVTAIVIPCVLIILLQIFKIIKVNRMEEEEYLEEAEAEIELGGSDDVVFSTLKEAEREASASVPYPEAESEPLPVSRTNERPRSLFSQGGDPLAQAKKDSIPGHFSQKPTAKKLEAALEHHFDPPKPPAEPPVRETAPSYPLPEQRPVYEQPVYAEKPTAYAERISAPTASEAPAHTPAPSVPVHSEPAQPKQSNRQTVEDLMRVINQAQSDLKK